MSQHPAYRKIIQLGAETIPLILRELKRQPDHWFPALSEITGFNPVSPYAEGKIGLMSDAWIRWGKGKGYLGDVD